MVNQRGRGNVVNKEVSRFTVAPRLLNEQNNRIMTCSKKFCDNVRMQLTLLVPTCGGHQLSNKATTIILISKKCYFFQCWCSRWWCCQGTNSDNNADRGSRSRWEDSQWWLDTSYSRPTALLFHKTEWFEAYTKSVLLRIGFRHWTGWLVFDSILMAVKDLDNLRSAGSTLLSGCDHQDDLILLSRQQLILDLPRQSSGNPARAGEPAHLTPQKVKESILWWDPHPLQSSALIPSLQQVFGNTHASKGEDPNSAHISV